MWIYALDDLGFKAIGDEFSPEAQHGMIFIAQARTPDQVGVKSCW